jgi:hypothetical protein
MISLSQEEPFARGGRRACYRHPEHAERCIKIALEDKQPHMLRSVDPWWKRIRPSSYYDENEQDLRIYAQLDKRLGSLTHAHFPKIYGLVETDLGIGLESELIHDADGRISLSGKEYTMQNGLSSTSEEAIKNLSVFLVHYLILFRDPFPHNIVLQEQADASLRAVIIDGLGRKPFLSKIFRQTSGKRTLRKTDRLRKGLKRSEHNRQNGVKPKPNGMLSYR